MEISFDFNLKLFQQIGYGAFSQVYLGEYDSKNVAIKVMDPCYIEQFKKEVEILESIHHQNFAQYYYSKETQNSLYIVQEFLDGKTLTQLIKTVEMEETHIKQIINELLNAVSYLHSQDIIHRDIKPDNIIITTEGQLKLIDFGLSSHSESKLSYDKCGTLLFMAPEMIFKQPYLKSVDIWSCGIIAYQLINKKHPFWDTSESISTFIQRVQQFNPDLSEMNDYQRSFFLKCAAYSPEARMNANQAIQHPWLSGEGELWQPITMADMKKLFDNKMKTIQTIKALMMIKYLVQKFGTIIPNEFSNCEFNDSTADTNINFKLKLVKSSSRNPIFIKQVRSTSTIFFESNNLPSPIRFTYNNKRVSISPNKTMLHSEITQFSQIAKRNTQVIKLPPLSNSPVMKKQRKSNLNFRLKQY
ncbi:unnamed protein product [Paramecium pentaurelia]|uniref:Protein kinase domain-containing protein n=1 Tax=Paramecium pentaurelia TaxID=43138 RepID=A0A8S1XJ16_9CILI|nr:unnamed protein product [Paramecium pentaurelia]